MLPNLCGHPGIRRNVEEILNDPDFKKIRMLWEQMEFWKELALDESVPEDSRIYPANKFIEITDIAVKSWNRLKEKYGPFPEPNYNKIRNTLAQDGIELTVDQIERILKENEPYPD